MCIGIKKRFHHFKEIKKRKIFIQKEKNIEKNIKIMQIIMMLSLAVDDYVADAGSTCAVADVAA